MYEDSGRDRSSSLIRPRKTATWELKWENFRFESYLSYFCACICSLRSIIKFVNAHIKTSPSRKELNKLTDSCPKNAEMFSWVFRIRKYIYGSMVFRRKWKRSVLLANNVFWGWYNRRGDESFNNAKMMKNAIDYFPNNDYSNISLGHFTIDYSCANSRHRTQSQ